MKRFRRRAALTAAVGSVERSRTTYLCEPLEQRRLLDASDPVIVMTEGMGASQVDTVSDHFWHNPDEFSFDPHLSNWNNADGNGNGLPDDGYGWNFYNNSPNLLTG